MVYRVSGREEQTHAGRVRDISSGGLRFSSGQRLRVGDLVAAVIRGGGPGAAGTSITVSAIVRVLRCRKVGGRYEIGAQFVG